MKTEIYKISQLQEFIQSENYLSSRQIPVSPERALSYINNPRAEADMPVLFLCTENDKLLAYRTLLPDSFQSGGEAMAFAWLSGNYVDPDYRRKGLSTKLYKEVNEAWKGKLMYTNYAPASKAVYDKTQDFTCFSKRDGKRYYMRSSLAELMKDRIRSGAILRFGDRLLNGIHDAMISTMDFPVNPETSITVIKSFDTDIKKLIEKAQDGSLFKRTGKEFKWIIDFPWITKDPLQLQNAAYQFRRVASRFKNNWYRLENSSGVAFLWITILDEKCSVPYFFHNDKKLLHAARQIVLREMIENQSAYISIRHPELGPLLGLKKNPFYLSRSMPQNYFAHKNLLKYLPGDDIIHDGDGDCVFS